MVTVRRSQWRALGEGFSCHGWNTLLGTTDGDTNLFAASALSAP